MRSNLVIVSVFCLLFSQWMLATTHAALSSEQKKELKEIEADIVKVGKLIVTKKLHEATDSITEIEERISSFASNAGLKEKDQTLKSLRSKVESAKKRLWFANEKAASTFEKKVASIIMHNCLECHAENGKGGLRLDTFENLERGGSNGPLIVPGDVESSLLMQRLIVPHEALRMPFGREPLSEREILAIGAWIQGGAEFEGDRTASMAELVKSGATVKPAGVLNQNRVIKTEPKKTGVSGKVEKPELAKMTGKETVQFSRDIMPEMVDTCGRCHNDRDKRSGFSVMSFEKLMKGGESGRVIVPGHPETSRLWRLVNADEMPVMPFGNQTGITRKWHSNLKTWILEGAKFDGVDPKMPFPTLQEREVAALAKFTPEQWLEKRKKVSEDQWKKTFPKIEPNRRESALFLIYGDVSDERLEQVERWATEQTAYLRQVFNFKEEFPWRGKLAIFVFKDRFGYEEFNTSVRQRNVSPEVLGHSHVNVTMEEALVAVQDVGDDVMESQPGMRVNVIANLTEAFLKRFGKLPDWLSSGAAFALAHQKSTGNSYLASLPFSASRILRDAKLSEPVMIFSEETFSPGEVGPIGCTIVEFLIKHGGIKKFIQFLQKIHAGIALETAVQAVYQTDCRTIAVAFVETLPDSGKKIEK